MRLCDDLGRLLDKVVIEYRLCVMGDPNECVGDRNGRRVVVLSALKGCIVNMYFVHKNIHKYIRVLT